LKPAPFEYHRPATVAEATSLLADLGEDAKPLAGGQSLIPMMALRLAVFPHLVDIGHIPEMKGIERRNGGLWIGAGTTEAAVGSNAEVDAAVPLLAGATPLIGHFQIRNRGTLGGSLVHADPAAEYPAVALALDAEMEVVSSRGARSIPASGFFAGHWSTTMAPDEILTGVAFPVWGERSGFAVKEVTRRHGDFAIAGATVGIELDAEDRIRRCAIGLLGLSSTPLRGTRAEEAAVGRLAADIDKDEIGRMAVEGLESVPSDLHGTAEYRTRVGAVMVARALADATWEAGNA
jgi:carbon-monoxide dehydrogenase medium subunit